MAFSSPDGGVSLVVQPGFELSRDPFSSTFVTATWRVVPPSAGSPPGSVVVRLERIASRGKTGSYWLTLQIGASRSPDAVRTCTSFGGHLELFPARDRRLGAGWSTIRAGDAGMSQQIQTTEFRIVRDGTCWAISSIVSGETASLKPAPTEATLGLVSRQVDLMLKTIRLIPLSSVRPTLPGR